MLGLAAILFGSQADAESLQHAPTDAVAHARLAELSGFAPIHEALVPEAAIRRAWAHPYDPAALLGGAIALANAQQLAEATGLLERVVWLADLDPESALTALEILRDRVPGWRTRRIVPVQVHADAATRSTQGWQFVVRAVWWSASNSLDGILRTRFVPIVIGDFDPEHTTGDLNAIHAEYVERVEPPAEGIAAVMISRPGATAQGEPEAGVAELLGRSLAIRITPRTDPGRVLMHEILHLYGAIHISAAVDSLMNRSGASRELDPVTRRIVTATIARAFGPGGIERNVFPHVDLRETTDAYVDALETNRSFPDTRVSRASTLSRIGRASGARPAPSLDPHFADVARIVAVMLLADSRREEALRLLDQAVDLYGSAVSERAAQTARAADLLRRDLARSQLAVADPGSRARLRRDRSDTLLGRADQPASR